MRLNRGTLVLLLASLVVIVAVLLLNNNQASAPDTTTPLALTAETAGPLFNGLEYAAVRSVEIVNNTTGEQTTLTKRQTGDWLVSEATYATDREVDQPLATGFVQTLVDLQINESFASESLADFGLTTPAYVVTLNTDEGTAYNLYVGNTNPTGNRYYALLETVEGTAPAIDDSTAEATGEAEATTEAATDEPSTEVTLEATADVTAEVTAEGEAMVDVTTEVTSEATVEPYQGVTLGASGTVILISLNAIDDIIGQITVPPYVPAPTPTPTPSATLNPLSEVEQATATAQINATLTAVMDSLIATATAQATVEVTAEATAE